MVGAIRQPHPPQQVEGLGLAAVFSPQFERHEHVLPRRQCRDQLEILKDEAHEFVPDKGALVLG